MFQKFPIWVFQFTTGVYSKPSQKIIIKVCTKIGKGWKPLNCFFLFFYCYLATPRPTLGHYRGGSLTHPMLITCALHILPDGHREPRSEVGSLSPAKCLVGFEPETFRFWSQRLNQLGRKKLHTICLTGFRMSLCIPPLKSDWSLKFWL